MIKQICLLVILGCFFQLSYSQCDKKYRLKTERIYSVNPDSTEGNEMPFQAELRITKDSIIINIVLPDGNTLDVTGKHSETVCKMNPDYTEGTIDWKTDAEMNRSGESRQEKMVFQVESKGGKMKVYGMPESQQGEKICFVIKEKIAEK